MMAGGWRRAILWTACLALTAAGCSGTRGHARPAVTVEQVRQNLSYRLPEALAAWVATDPAIAAMSEAEFQEWCRRQSVLFSATDLSDAERRQFLEGLADLRAKARAATAPSTTRHS